MKVFLAPGFFKNIKRSVADGVRPEDVEVKGGSL